MAATTQMSSVSEFNPRLRLDLSSGQNSLRSLKESTSRLPKPPNAPPQLPGGEGEHAFMMPVVDYDKAITLMRGRHTHDMHERHIASLRKIAAVNHRGFYMQDLAASRELLALAAERLRAGLGEYEGAVIDLLVALSVPFQKTRSNDDIRYENDVLGLVLTAAELALDATPQVAAACLEMLLALAVPPPPSAAASYARSADALAREAMALGPRLESMKVLKMITKAGAIPAIVAAVARAAEAEASGGSRPGTSGSSRAGSFLGPPPAWERPTLAAMRLLRAVSRDADGANAVLSSESVGAVLARLELPVGHPQLPLAVETVWNCLEASPDHAAKLLATPDEVARLADLHARTLAPGASDADKELRNEVVVLATLLAKSASKIEGGKAALVEGGMYSSLLDVLTADSARLISNSEVNLELLTLSLQFLLLMTGAGGASSSSSSSEPLPPSAAEADEMAGLVPSLMLCLDAAAAANPAFAASSASSSTLGAPPGTSGGLPPIAARLWTAAQRSSLMKQAFKLLTNLAVSRPEEICNDPNLGGLLAAYLRPENGTSSDLRDAALSMLVTALPLSTSLQGSAGESGCVSQLVQLVSEVTFSGAPSALAPFSTFTVATTAALKVPSGLDAKGMQASVLALALLCADSSDNQQRFGEAGGVACLLPLLKPRTDPALLHAVIECVWSAIAPSTSNVTKLVERDGVLQLLDILEKAPFSPRAHLLSCLADLMASDEGALEQVREWHGTKRQSASQLCLQLWQEEAARRGGATGNGLITSTARPLTGGAAADAYVNLNASLYIDVADMQPDEGAGGATMGADAITASSLRLKTANQLRIEGRGVGGAGAGSTAMLHQASLEKVDVRAKLYAVLAGLDFDSSVPYTSEEALLLVAAKGYVPFATAEEWANAADEFASDGVVPLDADRKMLDEKLMASEEAVALYADEQSELVEEMAISDEAADDANLQRVRVLRDGPMGQVKTTRRGSSLFRARIEAKAKIGQMVANSKVGFRGPMPTADEYADATLLAATEAMLEAGQDPAVTGFTLRHVPQALSTLASAAGIDPSAITPFLSEAGVGLTATGKDVKSPASIKVKVPEDGGRVAVDPIPLEKDKFSRVSPDKLRQLCIEFQARAAELAAEEEEEEEEEEE